MCIQIIMEIMGSHGRRGRSICLYCEKQCATDSENHPSFELFHDIRLLKGLLTPWGYFSNTQKIYSLKHLWFHLQLQIISIKLIHKNVNVFEITHDDATWKSDTFDKTEMNHLKLELHLSVFALEYIRAVCGRRGRRLRPKGQPAVWSTLAPGRCQRNGHTRNPGVARFHTQLWLQIPNRRAQGRGGWLGY